MIHGEGDAGRDMNVLSYEFEWGNARIIAAYNRMSGCGDFRLPGLPHEVDFPIPREH